MAGTAGVAETEELDLLRGDSSAGEVGGGLGAGGRAQVRPKCLFSHLVQTEDGGPDLCIGVGILGALRHGDAAALGEQLQRFIEADPLDLLDELEDIAALAAAEAFEELMVGVDPEGRGLLVMEGAQAGVALGRANPPQPDVLADYADNIHRRLDLSSEIQFLQS